MLRAALILSFISMTAFGQFPRYSVTVIPPPSGFTSVGMQGINNFGQVAGQGVNGTGTQAFIGSTSGSAPIPVPAGSGWTSSFGEAVNNLGQIAGSGGNSSGGQAFIGTAAGSTVIPPPAGSSGGVGYAVNDSGQVVGFDGYDRLYIGTTAGSTAFPTPAGWNAAVGQGVNSFGQIVGYIIDSSAEQAFITTPAGITPIPYLPDVITSQAVAVNDLGQVAGVANFNLAFIATTAGSVLIPPPIGATYSGLSGGCINNSGMVVGFTEVGGWIWDAINGSVPLNNLVPAGWYVYNAISISNNGHILALATFEGGPYQYVDLCPTGVPAAPTLSYPENGLAAVPTTTTLTWQTAIGATSYDVYFGTSPSLAFVKNVTTSSYTPATLAPGTTYYWQVVARNSVGTTGSAISTFTTLSAGCSFSASPSPVSITSVGGVQSVGVTAGAGCSWTATSTAPWLALIFASGTGTGSIQMEANYNHGTARLGYIHFANQTLGVMQGGSPSAALFNDVSAADPYFDYVSLMST